MRQTVGTASWVGRGTELSVLAGAVEALGRGEGSVVWVEGEPGIGKSSLVARALTMVGDPDWETGWGTADPLSERLPLGVMRDCLGVRPGSDDPRRAQAAGILRDGRRAPLPGTPTAGIEELLALVDTLGADAPLIMVIDDLQWADDASLVAFHQLAISAGQMPLLLIATCRPVPRRPDVREVRAAVERRGAAMIELGPLPVPDVAEMVTMMLGAPPGDALRQLTGQAGGNPLYLRELVDALVREEKVTVGSGTAEVPEALERLSLSLSAVLEDRLTSVAEETGKMLRTAALLGGPFEVTDLAVLTGTPASALAETVREAVAVDILVESGQKLAFRHPLLRQALYESMPEGLRSALHAEGARELAARGADALSVAQQLSMSGRSGEEWTRSWLETAAPVLILRAPRLAVDLLRREVDEVTAPGEAWEGLMASLVRALAAAGSYDEAMSRAGRALREITDPTRLAETHSVVARTRASVGQNGQAVTMLREALARADLPGWWRARILSLLAMLYRTETGDLKASEAAARQALGLAAESGDAFVTARALIALWLTDSVRRRNVAALDHVDRALDVLGDDPGHADLRSFAYDGRVSTLQALGRWSEAGETLREATRADQRDKSPARKTRGIAAVHWYWTGQWDDALAELDLDGPDWVPGLSYTYMREGWPHLLAHGVTALIAGRRDQRTTAGRHLRQGLDLPVQGPAARENREFLLAAQAISLEQAGETRQAMKVLSGFVHRAEGELTLTYQWLPDLVRLAVTAGDRPLARSAAQACEAEAEAESHPGRAAPAALRCAGLLRSDPGALREAVARYRETGAVLDLPAALEDLAAVLAERNEEEEARALLNEAVGLYEGFGAYWDIRRADGRLRSFGIRRGARGRRGPRPASGWEALTPAEVKIAALIGAGQSTSDIASGMFLSRRTVQKHVSNILAKLGAKSRVEIVREVLRQGIAGLRERHGSSGVGRPPGLAPFPPPRTSPGRVAAGNRRRRVLSDNAGGPADVTGASRSAPGQVNGVRRKVRHMTTIHRRAGTVT